MYGFDYSTFSGDVDTKGDWSGLKELSSFHEAEKTCGLRDEVANMTIWNAAVEKTGHLMDDMFTYVIMHLVKKVCLPWLTTNKGSRFKPISDPDS
jgi:hypothetical protein